MRISIAINGTRGDVQPMLALALELIKKGHEIVFCAPPENEELVRRYNCPFTAFGPNYKELFAKNARMKGGATKSPSPKPGICFCHQKEAYPKMWRVILTPDSHLCLSDLEVTRLLHERSSGRYLMKYQKIQASA